ncbi:MAG TPA: YigZ family protein [Caldilineaceae bacterium]|nr:YigZ family protein [Caldilineaceae bacterium]
MTTGVRPAQRYSIPANTFRVEEEILRSRFITTVGYTPTVAAAREFISLVSGEFATASHNCWAYVVGPPGSSGQNGLSDDGEPHGTAGRPMLTVLLHSGVGDICAVVTRYFGGTLLGKGGLVKAYSGGVQLALAGLPTIERVPKAELLVVVEYGAVSALQRLFAQYEVAVLEQEFAADLTCRLSLPVERLADFSQAVVDLSHGQALIEVVRKE